jgi:hypothetical protein
MECTLAETILLLSRHEKRAVLSVSDETKDNTARSPVL